MNIRDLITMINERVNFRYFANRFPSTSPDRCAAVVIQPGQPADSWLGTRRPDFQILVRGEPLDFEFTEQKANEIFDVLTNARHVKVGEEQIVQIFASSSAPFFIGLDENERPIYSMNFTALLAPHVIEN
ncbi:minor capsid protein [Thermoactinomyces vulgaris]|jgi:hypothetical protein|uniref:minor capsid protein n=1 Tax=Thermoactinomyces vulgaris TaxID=2026 RepID=UPI0036446541